MNTIKDIIKKNKLFVLKISFFAILFSMVIALTIAIWEATPFVFLFTASVVMLMILLIYALMWIISEIEREKAKDSDMKEW